MTTATGPRSLFRTRAADFWQRLSALAVWVADHELILLACLAPILLFPMFAPPLAALALACIPMLWLARWSARGRLTLPTPLDWPLIVFFALVAVGIRLSVVPALAAEKGAGLVLGLAAYYAVVNSVRRETSLWFAAGIVAAVGAALALVGLFGTTWWASGKTLPLQGLYQLLPQLFTAIPRSRTGGIHPNEIGGALVLMLPPALATWLAIRRDPRLQRLLGVPPGVLFAIALLIAVMLVLVQSRGAWLGILGASVAVLAMRRRWIAWVVIVFTLVACGLLSAAILPRLSANDLLSQSETVPVSLARVVIDMDNLTRPDWQGYAPNWLNRIEIWRNALLTLYDYPFTGVGLAALPRVSAANYIYQVTGAQFVLEEMTHAHNIYLEAAANFGVVGLVAFLALLLSYFAAVFRGLRTLPGEQRLLLLGLAAGVLAHFLHGLVDAIAFGAKPGILLWSLFGLSMAVMRRDPALQTTEDGGRKTDGGRLKPSVLRPFWSSAVVFALLGLLLLPSGWASSARLNRAALALDYAQLYPTTSPGERRALVEQILPELEHLAALTNTPNLRPGAAARRLGMAYLALGQTDAARAAFRGDPQAAAYLFSQGMMHAGGPDQSETILAFYRMATEIDPMTDLIYCRIAGGLDEAQAETAVFISDEPAPPPAPDLLARCHETLGQKFIERNQWSEAIVELQRAVELVPDSAAYQQQLGWTIYRARGDLSQAALALQRAAELDPTSMWPCLMLSQLRREQGLLEEAIAWADAAIQRAPGNPTPLVYRAQALVEVGQYRQAEATLEEALALEPRLGGAYFWLGTIKWRTGDPAAAIMDYERAVELEPNNIGYRLGLADAYRARGRRAEAVAAYEAVLRIDRNNAAAQERLAALRER